MIIGIDVDGVLVDLSTYQLDKAIPYFKEKYNLDVKNPKGYDLSDIFGCTHEQREKFWTKYIWEYCLKADMTPKAADTVRHLREQGHKIYVITGRAHTTETGITGKLFRWMLKHWLKKNKFEYDQIFFVSEKNSSADKYDICINEHVDLLVDDKPCNLYALKDKIRVACYPAIWNQDIKDLDQHRIDKFEDILNMI